MKTKIANLVLLLILLHVFLTVWQFRTEVEFTAFMTGFNLVFMIGVMIILPVLAGIILRRGAYSVGGALLLSTMAGSAIFEAYCLFTLGADHMATGWSTQNLIRHQMIGYLLLVLEGLSGLLGWWLLRLDTRTTLSVGRSARRGSP
jgi:hypothetical protein